MKNKYRASEKYYHLALSNGHRELLLKFKPLLSMDDDRLSLINLSHFVEVNPMKYCLMVQGLTKDS